MTLARALKLDVARTKIQAIADGAQQRNYLLVGRYDRQVGRQNRSSQYFVHSKCLVHNRRLKFQIFRRYGEYFQHRRNLGEINQSKELRYP